MFLLNIYQILAILGLQSFSIFLIWHHEIASACEIYSIGA